MTTSTRRSNSTPRNVSKPASPGPAPTRYTFRFHTDNLADSAMRGKPEASRLVRRSPPGWPPIAPSENKLRDVFLRGVEFVREVVHLRRVFAEKFRVGEQTFDARHLGLDGMNLRFHAFEFALLLEGQFARF